MQGTTKGSVMSRKLLNIAVDELDTVRITCQVCKSAIELKIAKITTNSDLRCPCCSPIVYRNGNASGADDAYITLAIAIRKLKDEKQGMIEFVLEQE